MRVAFAISLMRVGAPAAPGFDLDPDSYQVAEWRTNCRKLLVCMYEAACELWSIADKLTYQLT